MTIKPRTDLLTTVEMFHLDQACTPIAEAFGARPYLVGSAGVDNDGGTCRDVDVRLMLGDAEFASACPTQERWHVLCLALSVYLSERTGLKVDFQVQLASVANEAFHGRRNPLGMGRVLAGGGDATPDWDAV